MDQSNLLYTLQHDLSQRFLHTLFFVFSQLKSTERSYRNPNHISCMTKLGLVLEDPRFRLTSHPEGSSFSSKITPSQDLLYFVLTGLLRRRKGSPTTDAGTSWYPNYQFWLPILPRQFTISLFTKRYWVRKVLLSKRHLCEDQVIDTGTLSQENFSYYPTRIEARTERRRTFFSLPALPKRRRGTSPSRTEGGRVVKTPKLGPGNDGNGPPLKNKDRVQCRTFNGSKRWVTL